MTSSVTGVRYAHRVKATDQLSSTRPNRPPAANPASDQAGRSPAKAPGSSSVSGLDTVSLEEATEGTNDTDAVPRPEYIADWRQSPEELVHKNEIKRLLDEALGHLDEKRRVVFLLRDVEGLSVQETAEALGLSEANIKVRLLRARLQLREELTRSLGDPEQRLLLTHNHSH